MNNLTQLLSDMEARAEAAYTPAFKDLLCGVTDFEDSNTAPICVGTLRDICASLDAAVDDRGNLIKALRKALEQRNKWAGFWEGLKIKRDGDTYKDDQQLADILSGGGA